jgi:uncharacterized protein DUF3291
MRFKRGEPRTATVARMSDHLLAQLNIAVPRGALDSAMMTEFVMLLDPVNALADRAPGFVWRHRPVDGDVTVSRQLDREDVILNLSVWEDVDALREFTFSGVHLRVMRRRKAWFKRISEIAVVLWWIPASHRPTIDEGLERLDILRRDGPTPAAFSMKEFFPAPSTIGVVRGGRTR